MPRPEIDPELFIKWDAELNEAEKGLPHILANPAAHAKIHDVGLASKWLKHELEQANVESDKVERFFNAFSQKAFMAPDVWSLAVKTIEIFKSKFTAPQEVAPNFDISEEDRKQLFETYTKVHVE